MYEFNPVPTEGQHKLPAHMSGVNHEIMAKAQYVGLSPQSFLEGVGLMKADNNGKRTPGIGNQANVLRSQTEPYFDTYSAKGVREKYRPVDYAILRELARKNPIVAAILNIRRKQLRPFGDISKDNDKPGFRIALLDDEKKPTHHEKNEMLEIAKWFKNTGSMDVEGAENRKSLQKVQGMMMEEYLVIDRPVIEPRRNRKGDIIDFWPVDGATIKTVVKSGYRGTKADFDPRMYIPQNPEKEREVYAEKMALVPDDMSKIAYVQQVEGRYTAAYTHKDIIVDALQERVDIRYTGHGHPPVEQAMQACAAFLFSMAYNAEQFNNGTLPKIALAFKEGNFSTEQLMSLQDEWISNFRGIQGAWRIPMLNADVTVLDLYKNARDMEFRFYMEFMTALICSILSIDPQEIGLRVMQAQNVLSESQGSRLQFSKNRGLNDGLGAMSDVWNQLMSLMRLANRYCFKYTGIEPEDREVRSKLETDAVKRDTTINEIRAKKDMKPLPYGDIILDPTYLQYVQAKEMEAQGAEQEENAGAMDEGIDEAFDEMDMFKAKKVVDKSKVRTLLV